MENEDSKEMSSRFAFLNVENAEELFSEVDYHLKNGKHIQDRKLHARWYRFIENNYESLKNYYLVYFKLQLRYSGNEPNKYFYLEFLPENREGVPLDFRVHLKTEHVIVAFLLYKIVFIDRNLELSSIAELKRLLKYDYEDIRPDLIRLFAKVRELKASEMNDDKIDAIIESAMREFNNLGWIEIEDDHFDVMPSIDRIYILYTDQINDLYNQLKSDK